MKSIDHLLDRKWTQDYTCNEFACETWELLTNESLTDRLNAFLNGEGSFEVLESPVSPCLVFFGRRDAGQSHVGVFYDGRLLHLSSKGVQYVEIDIVAMGFRTMRFYR